MNKIETETGKKIYIPVSQLSPLERAAQELPGISRTPRK
jgi:hypothetical protein